ncbi:hypothetical protein GOARA_063_00230 [Gordonia araii NBRC 100433]|uniref:Uncharacterized protein n=1 Tax=Gordonia araii NBRC 100433 TaxID=1073574 RepID=G7H4P9_9ACTN|nr:hypothetical protein [Gordonia araii]NNG98034.1 hypothetical protein [Gordonia araii NBRC 100433]GAB10824.1 hypothetical protein GOARA_063_00230 [Gordonia araii NBRC 100433]
MQLITDSGYIESAGGALLRRVGDWATVGGVAGTGFEAYARILHPVDVTDEHGASRRMAWRDVAAVTGAQMHPQVQWWAVAGRSPAEATDCYSMTLPNGWQLTVDLEGRLDPAIMAELTTLLAAHIDPMTGLFAAIWAGWGELHGPDATLYLVASDGPVSEQAGPRPEAVSTRLLDPAVTRATTDGPFLDWPGREMLVFATSLEELGDPEYGYRSGIGWDHRFGWGPVPALVWPRGDAWVVATEVDWAWTLVGGTRSLIDEILSDARFESFEVVESDELTFESDNINRT